ncbi:MAG: hypothetical protein MJ252_30015 [archaeon]|nr:hypothetical protein [archaeon]
MDYLTILKGLNENRKKKILRGEIIPLNLIPYLDYNQKYSIDRQKNIVTFKEYAVQAPYWLRIFASNDVYISELPFPYQCQISETSWSKDESDFTAGGARKNYEEKVVTENFKWPINPQYIITFEKNIRMKIVLRKTQGYSMGEGNSIGFILCKPDLNTGDDISLKQRKKMNEAKAFSKTASSSLGKTKEMGLTGLAGVALKTMGGFNLKAEQITRVMESTVRILENKRNTLEGVTPKMFLNSSEFLVESSYNNAYAACLYLTFNRIDSPLIIIPTLDSPDVSFGFEINVFSNRAANIYPLNTKTNQMLLGDWNNQNCGGCHLSADEKRRGKNIGISLDLNWYNNPKYLLSFKDKKPDDKISFEVVLSRSEIIWKPIIARGVVNAMIGIYLFENEGEWKEHCVNIKTIDFLPKNYMSVKFDVEHVPRKGFIIMPVTYGFGVKGPFLLMVKSKEEYQLTKLEDNFK